VDLSKYRPLTPEQEPASDEQQSTVDGNTATGNQTGNLADTGITAKSEQAVITAKSEQAVADEQVPSSETQASAPMVQAPNLTPSDMPQQYPGQQGGMPRDIPQMMATAPHFPPPSPPMEEPEATQEELQLITSARQAFWERDIEQAEKHYKALSALQADNPDPYGELGNVYYSAGQWDKAADAYYQAGERLIQRGQYRRTMHLVSVLRGLNTERATALNNLLNDALPKTVSQPDNKTNEPAEITSK
jgi:tetratricopeptide (TPR) repeat protein